jgi:hypothetical protein
MLRSEKPKHDRAISLSAHLKEISSNFRRGSIGYLEVVYVIIIFGILFII